MEGAGHGQVIEQGVPGAKADPWGLVDLIFGSRSRGAL